VVAVTAPTTTSPVPRSHTTTTTTTTAVVSLVHISLSPPLSPCCVRPSPITKTHAFFVWPLSIESLFPLSPPPTPPLPARLYRRALHLPFILDSLTLSLSHSPPSLPHSHPFFDVGAEHSVTLSLRHTRTLEHSNTPPSPPPTDPSYDAHPDSPLSPLCIARFVSLPACVSWLYAGRVRRSDSSRRTANIISTDPSPPDLPGASTHTYTHPHTHPHTHPRHCLPPSRLLFIALLLLLLPPPPLLSPC